MSIRSVVLTLLVVAALSLSATEDGPPAAPPSPLDARVDAYLAAYARADFDALARMLSPDARFEDADVEHAGRDAMLASLRTTFASTTIDVLDLGQRIHGGERHVLCSGRVVFRMDATTFGVPGRELVFDMPMAIALKLDAELAVVRHVDYVDRPAWVASARAQLEAFAAEAGGGDGR